MWQILKISICLLIICVNTNPASADSKSCDDLFDRHCRDISCSGSSIVNAVILDLTGKVKSPEVIDSMNRTTLTELNAVQVPGASAGRKNQLSAEEINALYDGVSNHPVASLRFYDKYDPQNRGIGFCFGRAMTAHLEALWGQKLNNSSIRKIWAVGELQSGGTKWRYHVSTLIKGADGNWWAIDPIMGKPMHASEWYTTMRSQYDSKQQMRIFVTEGKRFGPSEETAYRREKLNYAVFNGYFYDLLQSYRTRLKKESLPAANN